MYVVRLPAHSDSDEKLSVPAAKNLWNVLPATHKMEDILGRLGLYCDFDRVKFDPDDHGILLRKLASMTSLTF